MQELFQARTNGLSGVVGCASAPEPCTTSECVQGQQLQNVVANINAFTASSDTVQTVQAVKELGELCRFGSVSEEDSGIHIVQ